MQIKYALTSLLFLLVGIYTSNAQQKLDSLLRELNNHKTEDTVRFKLLIATGVAYQRNNPDKGIEMSDSAIALAKNLHLPAKIADAYNTKASNYYFKA